MILFIEPHYDDFILSAGMYSLQRPVDKIITVFSSKHNTEGTRALCKDLGKEYEELGFSNIDWKHPILSFNLEDLRSALASQLKKASCILTVLGVGNYAHKFLRDFIIDTNTDDIPMFFLRDFPHAYDKTKLGYLPFEEYIKDFSLLRTFGNDIEFRQKIDLFKKYYPSQKSLLWFEREQFSNPVQEEIYEFKPTVSLW